MTFLISIASLFIIYQIYLLIYFSSDRFNLLKNSIQNNTIRCNELNHHIEELKYSYVDIKAFDYGESSLLDKSKYNFSRKEWSKHIQNERIHLCSSIVCKNAANQPFKYLCKYFNIKPNENNLSKIESTLNNFSAVEQGKELLKKERDEILENISNHIPVLFYIFSKKRLMEELGFETIDFSDLYFPIYTFQYVSSGGNSSIKCDIKLNLENLDKFILYLSELVNFKNSIAGQRLLMTSKLREKIKVRDNYTCKICGLSINDEKNLLLEIDHIIPLSKGGITSEENLQTLCWKCNRSKGSK